MSEKTQELRNITFVGMLGYVTQMSLRASGRFKQQNYFKK